MTWTSITKELPAPQEEVWLYIPEQRLVVIGWMYGTTNTKRLFLINDRVYNLYDISHWSALDRPKKPSRFKSKEDRKRECASKY